MARSNKKDDNNDKSTDEALSSFLSDEAAIPINRKRVDTLVDTARRSDDPLLGALSLVLAANHDYAKSVSNLLSTDLSHGQTLAELREKISELTNSTNKLIASQEYLLEALSDLPDQHKELFELIIKSHEQRHEIYLDSKFSKLFQAAGLKKDGEEFGEADGLIRKIKYFTSRQVMTVVVGMMLYHMALWIIDHAQGIFHVMPK
jgi:cysteinyl-tRNA synthetase